MRSVSLLFVLMMTGLLGYGQDLSVVQIYTSPFKQGDTKWKELKTVDHENRPHFSLLFDGKEKTLYLQRQYDFALKLNNC